jgi:glycopeptide antibiotics resistance protein
LADRTDQNSEKIRTVTLLSRTLFAAYLLILLWLVLFKFSYDPIGVLSDLQTRSLNLIPFTRAHRIEMISNLVAFIPFGMMAGVNFKEVAFRYKIAVVFAFSLAVEITQFALAIGVADITDLIMNTLGGFIGLAAYVTFSKYSDHGYLDRCIFVAGTLILLAILYLRIFVFVVRY